MAPKYKVSLNAAELQYQYGFLLLQPPCSDATSPYLLHQTLKRREGILSEMSPIIVSLGAVKVWWTKYKEDSPLDALNAHELESRYGERVRSLVADNPTSYKLCRAMRRLLPPVYVTEAVAKSWLRKFGQYGNRVKVPAALKRPAAVLYRRLDANLSPAN